MTQIYNTSDYVTVKKQRKEFLRLFYITLAVLIAFNVALFVFYVFQEYNTKYRLPLLLINIISCSIYASIYFVLFALKYRRIKSYYVMLYYFQHGLKSENANVFVRIDSSVVVKDGVDFVNLVFLEWSEKKQEYFERYVLYDVEKPLPDFKKGDFVHFITQANKMIAYELRSNDIFE